MISIPFVCCLALLPLIPAAVLVFTPNERVHDRLCEQSAQSRVHCSQRYIKHVIRRRHRRAALFFAMSAAIFAYAFIGAGI